MECLLKMNDMDFKTFLSKFSEIAEVIFLDRNELKAPAKTKVWFDACLSDIKQEKYSPETVIRAMERLKRSDKRFLGVSDLINEIEQERFLEVG